MSYHDMVHPDDREGAAAEFERLKTGSTIVSYEFRARAKDGSYRWIQWTATPAPNELVIYAIGRDTTERKRAEQALRSSEEHYRELFNEAKAMQERLRELSSGFRRGTTGQRAEDGDLSHRPGKPDERLQVCRCLPGRSHHPPDKRRHSGDGQG